MISFEYYKIFYYVGKYKNFTKAARKLQTSQSAVSHAIQNLEHQLGCRLFSRSSRGVEFLPEGERLYEYVRLGCEQFFRGEQMIAEAVSLEKGTISISTTETAFLCCLSEILENFHKKKPGVRFRLMNAATSLEAIRAAEEGGYDFAAVPTPVAVPKGLEQITLMEFTDKLMVGSQYAFLAGKTISLKELSGYPFLCLREGTASREYFQELFDAHQVPMHVDIEAATNDMVIPLVKSNLGIGFTPGPVAKQAADREDIYEVHLLEELKPRHILLIFSEKRHMSLAAEEFRRYVRGLSLTGEYNKCGNMPCSRDDLL